jgi:hypothetical protein
LLKTFALDNKTLLTATNLDFLAFTLKEMRISKLTLMASAVTPFLLAQAPAPKPITVPVPAGQPTAPAVPAAEVKTFPADQTALSFAGKTYTAQQLDEMVANLPDEMKQSVGAMGKAEFIRQYGEFLILLDEARSRQIPDRADVKKIIDFQRDNLSVGYLMREMQKSAEPKDEETKAFYETKKGDYLRVNAKHILIKVTDGPNPTPAAGGRPPLSDAQALAKAESIIKQLADGGKFEELAKKESDDPGSGERGGDLGEFSRGMMVPEFEEAAFAQPPGIVSAKPVRSQFGYHIIRVEKRDFQPYEAVAGQIKQRLQAENLKKMREDLKTTKQFKLDPAYVESLSGPTTPLPGVNQVQPSTQTITVPVPAAPQAGSAATGPAKAVPMKAVPPKVTAPKAAKPSTPPVK